MLKGAVVDHLPDGRPIVEVDCGCQYADARGPLAACDAHRYMTCGRCGCKTAEVSPFGLLCPRCTFGSDDGE